MENGMKLLSATGEPPMWAAVDAICDGEFALLGPPALQELVHV